jgi:hypothetical protein
VKQYFAKGKINMKNKKLSILTILILSTFALSACNLPFFDVVRGSGVLATESRSVDGFDQIEIDGIGQLRITQGASETLEITAEDNILKEITSDVVEDKLVLGFRDQPWRTSVIPTRGIVYDLTLTDMNAIILNGAGEIEATALETSSLVLEINGTGKINIQDLTAETLTVKVSGAATILVDGQVNSQTVNIDGTANYNADDLQTDRTDIEINGLGTATVWASESLDIKIDGGGTLNYYGTPIVTQDVNGLGNIKSLGEK